jgi:Asp/Glu/hydantoin racemase
MSRVLVLVPVPLDDAGVEKRREQLNEVAVDPRIEFDFRSVKIGPKYFDSDHDLLLADLALTEAGLRAKDEGFDGVCVDTMSDSGVSILRSLLDIPVVGPGRLSFLTALMLGNRFSILTLWDRWAPGYRKTLREAGLEDKCVSIRWIGSGAPDLANLLSGKEEAVFPKLLSAAKECLAEGADVICLGSTTMHQAHRFLSEHLASPVVNPGPLTYKAIEFLLGLGLRQSPLAYPQPRGPQLELIEDMVRAAAGDSPRSPSRKQT